MTFKIKKIDEIRLQALKDRDVHTEIKDKIREVEQTISESLSENKQITIVEVGFQDYIFSNFSGKTAAQIVAFYVIEALNNSGYELQYNQSSDCIKIRIELGSKSSLENQFNDFFSAK